MNIFETTIQVIDATLRTSHEMADNLDICDIAEESIKQFKEKYKIPQETHLGMAEQWEDSTDEMHADSKKMEHDLMIHVWDHIKELMLNCGAGDVAKEVLAKELLDVKIKG